MWRFSDQCLYCINVIYCASNFDLWYTINVHNRVRGIGAVGRELWELIQMRTLSCIGMCNKHTACGVPTVCPRQSHTRVEFP